MKARSIQQTAHAMKALGYSVYVLYTTYITTPAAPIDPVSNIDLLPYINGTRLRPCRVAKSAHPVLPITRKRPIQPRSTPR